MLKKIILVILIFSSVYPIFSQIRKDNNPLTILLVRHAEKVDNSRDPELSEVGKQRAAELAATLKDAGLNHIHSTNFIRTKNTAQPTADFFNLEIDIYNPQDLPAFASKLKQSNGTHLVVGHSNTTPDLVKLLGGKPGTSIAEANEYDRLYVLTIGKNGKVNTVLLRYGEKFKPDE